MWKSHILFKLLIKNNLFALKALAIVVIYIHIYKKKKANFVKLKT